MTENAKKELDGHLLRIKFIADGWAENERHARTQELMNRLIEAGFLIDAPLKYAIDKFEKGSIDFDEFLGAFQKKIT